MTTGAAVDNDVLLKGAWYGLLRELVSAVPSVPAEAIVLGHAKFVVGKRLQKQKDRNVPGASRALASLTEFLAEAVQAEPSAEEQLLAATLENAAQAAGLALDSGESLLCAMVVKRSLPWLATGDKRAISALEALRGSNDHIEPISGRVVCLEQLFVRLLATIAPSDVRAAVCREAHVDKALAACFSCSSVSARPEDWCAGLGSYINALRSQAPTLLAP